MYIRTRKKNKKNSKIAVPQPSRRPAAHHRAPTVYHRAPRGPYRRSRSPSPRTAALSPRAADPAAPAAALPPLAHLSSLCRRTRVCRRAPPQLVAAPTAANRCPPPLRPVAAQLSAGSQLGCELQLSCRLQLFEAATLNKTN